MQWQNPVCAGRELHALRCVQPATTSTVGVFEPPTYSGEKTHSTHLFHPLVIMHATGELLRSRFRKTKTPPSRRVERRLVNVPSPCFGSRFLTRSHPLLAHYVYIYIHRGESLSSTPTCYYVAVA